MRAEARDGRGMPEMNDGTAELSGDGRVFRFRLSEVSPFPDVARTSTWATGNPQVRLYVFTVY